MGRKFDLKNEARRYLKLARQGSFATRKDRLQIIQLIIEDLFVATTHLPTQFKSLETKHIHDLIIYWKQKKLSPHTIQKRLSVLRALNQFAKLGLDIPSNKSLGLLKPDAPKTSKLAHRDNNLDKIYHPIIKSIVMFEVAFGLTKLESMRLSLSHALQENDLFIYRNIANNKKDRSVPIVTHQQKSLIADRRELISDAQSFIEILPERLLCYQYDAELMWAGINRKLNLRHLYFTERYRALSKSLDQKASIKVLLSETGLSSEYKLVPSLKRLCV